jgi:hypothetical protein
MIHELLVSLQPLKVAVVTGQPEMEERFWGPLDARCSEVFVLTDFFYEIILPLRTM